MKYCILRALRNVQDNEEKGGCLTFLELQDEAKDCISSGTTLSKYLDEVEEEGFIETTAAKRPVRGKENATRKVLAYRIAKHPSRELYECIRPNSYYKQLVDKLGYGDPPSKFLSKICDGIAKSLVSMWIGHRRDVHGPIDEFEVMRLMDDFDFLIRNYVWYRVHPETGSLGLEGLSAARHRRDLGKISRPGDFRVLAGIWKVRVDDKEYGEEYRKAFDELLDAARSG